MAKRSTFDRVFAQLKEELKPFPGRMSGSLRDVLCITLAVLLSETLQIPGISLSGAIFLLTQRERPSMTMRVALQTLLGTVASTLCVLAWVQWTDATEIARFLGIAILIYISAFCMSASTFPLFWTMFGFYGFVNFSYWDSHRSADAIVRLSLYNQASLALVMGCSVAVEYIFRTRHPLDELTFELKQRVQVLEMFFAALGSAETSPRELGSLQQHILREVHAGDYRLNELHDQLNSSLQRNAKANIGVQYRIGLLSRALEKSLAIRSGSITSEEGRQSCRVVSELCRQILAGENVDATLLPQHSPGLLRDIYGELLQYGQLEHTVTSPEFHTPVEFEKRRRLSFFQPDAFRRTDHITYALKLTLAAMICYIVYNAIDWPGILTCVVTVLFTGLTTTGAMKQKQLYRFTGAMIGGILGVLAESLFFPNMDSVTSLLILIAPIAFVSGWVLRSRTIGYVGVQIIFAFFLTALPGFSPALQISPARDRVIGVALGIGVMWFIFDQIWPTRTTDALQSILVQIQEATVQMNILTAAHETQSRVAAQFESLRATVSAALMQARQLDVSSSYELGRHQRREMARTRRLMRAIDEASSQFYLQVFK